MSSLSLDLLERLIGFETVSSESNLSLIDFVQDFLVSRGFRVKRLQDPEDPKAGLYAEIGPSGHGILLSAHTDVVPAVGQDWTLPPFKLTQEGDKLFGRGTTDMKGFLAEMLALADRASRAPLKEPLKLAISYDEEVACRGISRMWERLAPLLGMPRLALIGEPTEMGVVTGHKGKRAYRAEITGETGHSSLAPNFASALLAAIELVTELRNLQTELARSGARDEGYDIPYSTVHVGQMTSGTALNIVPDQAEVIFEFRHLAGDDPDGIAQKIMQAAKRVETSYDGRATATVTQTSAYPGLDTDPQSPAAQTILSCAGTKFGKVAYGTEAGFFARHGIPALVCGPGSMAGQGHKADEYIEREQLTRCAVMLDRLLEQIT